MISKKEMIINEIVLISEEYKKIEEDVLFLLNEYAKASEEII